MSLVIGSIYKDNRGELVKYEGVIHGAHSFTYLKPQVESFLLTKVISTGYYVSDSEFDINNFEFMVTETVLFGGRKAENE